MKVALAPFGERISRFHGLDPLLKKGELSLDFPIHRSFNELSEKERGEKRALRGTGNKLF